MEKRPKTIFLDIDGTLVHHNGSLSGQLDEMTLLPGVREKFDEWDRKGHNIILVTGRRESMRAKTEEQLRSFNLYWDQIIFGLGGGVRVLINDFKPNSQEPTAIAINLVRNTGIEDINI